MQSIELSQESLIFGLILLLLKDTAPCTVRFMVILFGHEPTKSFTYQVKQDFEPRNPSKLTQQTGRT